MRQPRQIPSALIAVDVYHLYANPPLASDNRLLSSHKAHPDLGRGDCQDKVWIK